MVFIFRIAGLFAMAFILRAQTSLAQEAPVPSYPKIMGYFSVIHPIVTMDKNGTTSNFSSSYVVGFPTGINILKSDAIGFSFEVVPFIKADSHDSKVSNFLFHPGIMFRRRNGFTITERAAFETSGRYGFTTVFNKIVKRNKESNIFIATSLPVRFGNANPASVGVVFQFGISF